MFDLYISMHSGTIWSASWVPGQPELHGKTLSLNKQKQQQKAKRMPGFGPMGMGYWTKTSKFYILFLWIGCCPKLDLAIGPSQLHPCEIS